MGTRVVQGMARVLFVLLLAGCAAGQPAASDRISGVVVLEQSEQALGGVRVVLVPQGGEAASEVSPGDYASETLTTEAGAFAFDALDGIEAGPLVRDWRYELRAEAAGFQTGRVEFDFEGGAVELRVVLALESDDSMQGQQIRELSDESIQNPEGTLIDEVLRQQGRLPRGKR